MAITLSSSLKSPPNFRPLLFLSQSRPHIQTLTTLPIHSSTNTSTMSTHLPRHKVVVCGGGVIGVCTAYFLSKNGAEVTLIEQSSIACAASGKAGGFLASDWCDGGPLSSLARTSFNLHRSLSDELNGTSSYGYRPLTTLSVTIDEGGEPTGRKNLPEWVNGPARKGRTIGTEESTAQVHPGMFTRVMMTTAVEKYGVEVVVGRVERVGMGEGDRVDSVVLNDGRVVEADSVVLALGPWSSKMALLSGLFRVYGLKAHSIVLEPRVGEEVITPHALFLSYLPAHGGKPMDPEVYPRPTGEVYICGMSATEEVPNDPDQITPNPESIITLKRVAENVSTHFKEGDDEAVVKAEQACFLPCTDDGLPVIGELPGTKGCFVATGHNCWGILNGPATGAALSQLILDGQATLVDLTPFDPARFVVAGRRR